MFVCLYSILCRQRELPLLTTFLAKVMPFFENSANIGWKYFIIKLDRCPYLFASLNFEFIFPNFWIISLTNVGVFELLCYILSIVHFLISLIPVPLTLHFLLLSKFSLLDFSFHFVKKVFPPETTNLLKYHTIFLKSFLLQFFWNQIILLLFLLYFWPWIWISWATF